MWITAPSIPPSPLVPPPLFLVMDQVLTSSIHQSGYIHRFISSLHDPLGEEWVLISILQRRKLRLRNRGDSTQVPGLENILKPGLLDSKAHVLPPAPSQAEVECKEHRNREKKKNPISFSPVSLLPILLSPTILTQVIYPQWYHHPPHSWKLLRKWGRKNTQPTLQSPHLKMEIKSPKSENDSAD